MTHPGPHRQAKSRVVSGRQQPRSVPRELVELSRKLAKVKAQARALGIFTDERELLECPNCGLLEDVTAKGLGARFFAVIGTARPALVRRDRDYRRENS
jgi:hypothetical protein